MNTNVSPKFQSPEDYLKDYDAYKAGKLFKIITKHNDGAVTVSYSRFQYDIDSNYYWKNTLDNRSERSIYEVSVVYLTHKFKNIGF